MQTHPAAADHPNTDKIGATGSPRLAVFGRERNRTARLCAVARSRSLSAEEIQLPVADGDLASSDLLLIDAGELSPEDRLWVRGVLSAAGKAPAIVISDTANFEGAVSLVSEGVDDVLDWTTLTSASLARAVHLTLARRRVRSAAPTAPANEPLPPTQKEPPRAASLTLLQECASAIMMVDPDGIVRFANSEAEKLLGVPEGSLAGAPFALEVNRNKREEIMLDGPDGRQVHAEVRVVETEHGDVPMRVVTLQDMSLRKALERHFAA